MCALRGSGSSHVAILARAMDIPAVMGAVDLPGYTSRRADYCRRPLRRGLHQSIGAAARERTLIAEQKLFEEELEELKDLPCITQNGWRVRFG